MALTDKLKTPIEALLVGPKPTLIDDQANLATIGLANGVQVCASSGIPYNTGYACQGVERPNWTTLSPNVPTMLLLRFESPQAIVGNRVSLAASLLLSTVTDPAQAKPANPESVSLSLANLAFSPVKPAP